MSLVAGTNEIGKTEQRKKSAFPPLLLKTQGTGYKGTQKRGWSWGTQTGLRDNPAKIKMWQGYTLTS